MRGLAEVPLATTLAGGYLVDDVSVFYGLAVPSLLGFYIGFLGLPFLFSILHTRALTALHRGDLKYGISLAKIAAWLSLGILLEDRKDCIAFVGTAYTMAGQPEKAIPFYRKGLRLAKKQGNFIEQVKTLHDLAAAMIFCGQIEQAITHLKKGLTLLEKQDDLDLQADLLNSLSGAYRRLNNLQQAISYGENALTLFGRTRNRAGQARILNNLSLIYGSLLNQFDKAIELTQRSLDLCKIIGDKSGEAMQHVQLGGFLMRQGQLVEAEKHCQAALSSGQPSPLVRYFALHNLATLARLRGEFERALELYHKALTLSQQLSHKSTEATTQIGLGITLCQLGRISYGRQALQKGLELSHALEDGNNLRLAHFYLGQSYESSNGTEDAAAAYQHYQRSIDVLETARASLVDQSDRIDFFGTEIRVDAYSRMVALCIRQHKFTEGFNYAERGKARALLELLASTDREDIRVEPLPFPAVQELIRAL